MLCISNNQVTFKKWSIKCENLSKKWQNKSSQNWKPRNKHGFNSKCWGSEYHGEDGSLRSYDFYKIHNIHIEYCKSDAILISNEALVETSSVGITSSASQPSLTTVIEQTSTSCETEFWVCNWRTVSTTNQKVNTDPWHSLLHIKRKISILNGLIS